MCVLRVCVHVPNGVFSPDSASHPVHVPQGTVDKWCPTSHPEQVKCIAGLPCTPASVPCTGICLPKSMFTELVGIDREECTNPLILTPKEEGGAERMKDRNIWLAASV